MVAKAARGIPYPWAPIRFLVAIILVISCSETGETRMPTRGSMEWASRISELGDSLDVAMAEGNTPYFRKVTDDILRLDPPDSVKVTMLSNLGSLKFTQGDYDSAVFFYEGALHLDPASAAGWGLAAAYAKTETVQIFV